LKIVHAILWPRFENELGRAGRVSLASPTGERVLERRSLCLCR
jgi:hypothetical protein